MSSSPTKISTTDERECNLCDVILPKGVGIDHNSPHSTSSPPSPSGSFASFDGYLNQLAKQAMWRSISSGSVPDDATDSRDETFQRRQRQRFGWINSSTIKGFYSSMRSGKDANPTTDDVDACVTGGGERRRRKDSVEINGVSIAEPTPVDEFDSEVTTTSRLSRKSKFQTTIRHRKKDMVNTLRSVTSMTSMNSSATGSNDSFDCIGTISSASRTAGDRGCCNGSDRRPAVAAYNDETLTRRTGQHRQRRSGDTADAQPSIHNLRRFGSDDSSTTDDGGSIGRPESMTSFSLNDVDDMLDEISSSSSSSTPRGPPTKTVPDEVAVFERSAIIYIYIYIYIGQRLIC